MSENNLDLFNSEFRHETVIKFIKDLIDGSIKLAQPTNPNAVSTFSNAYVEIIKNIEQFVSGRLQGGELEQVESRLFFNIGILRAVNAIDDVKNVNQIENQISKLHLRMDSTNTLLLQVLVILKELINRLDKK